MMSGYLRGDCLATMQIKGMNEYIEELTKIGKNTKEVCGAGVYAMADIVANEVRKGIKDMDATSNEDAMAAYRKKVPSKITKEQKEGLLDSLGITTMRDDNGFYNVKIGFDGYNTVRTKKYPHGQPNVLIARSAESGSSVMIKTAFMRKAVARARKKLLPAAQAAIDGKIYALKEGGK